MVKWDDYIVSPTGFQQRYVAMTRKHRFDRERCSSATSPFTVNHSHGKTKEFVLLYPFCRFLFPYLAELMALLSDITPGGFGRPIGVPGI